MPFMTQEKEFHIHDDVSNINIGLQSDNKNDFDEI